MSAENRPDLDDFDPDTFVSACEDEPSLVEPPQAGLPQVAPGQPGHPGHPGRAASDSESAPSRFHPFSAPFGWDGVGAQAYKTEGQGFASIIREVLVGPGDATQFHLRYFDLAPGGYSTLEKHGHAHAVVCVRGRGVSVVGTEARPMGLMDVVYVAPWTPHQFVNDSEEPFGFLCIVDAERDRPQPPSAEELAELKANPATAQAVRLG